MSAARKKEKYVERMSQAGTNEIFLSSPQVLAKSVPFER